MGELLSLGEVLGSAAVAAVISGVLSWLIARTTAKAQVETALIAADTARSKAIDAERKAGRDAFIAAVKAWDKAGTIASMEDADPSVRREQAHAARHSLMEVGSIVGPHVQTEEFNRLVLLLGVGDEESLAQAGELWNPVQQALMEALPRKGGLAETSRRR